MDERIRNYLRQCFKPFLIRQFSNAPPFTVSQVRRALRELRGLAVDAPAIKHRLDCLCVSLVHHYSGRRYGFALPTPKQSAAYRAERLAPKPRGKPGKRGRPRLTYDQVKTRHNAKRIAALVATL